MPTSDPSHHASIMNPLEERLGYKFRNGLLLAEALTHPSISLERKNYPFDNQQLEFLGDAVIQLVITEHLYRLYPDFSEGQMTKLRTRIVSRPALKVDRKSLLALRGVGPEFEAGSGSFHARTLPDRALRVKLPPFCGLGRAPNHKMAGSAGWLAGNTSLRGAPCRWRDCQFPANTGSWS